MRYLTERALLQLYEAVMRATGGSAGLRDRPLFESALAQPRATFGGEDLYPTLAEKAAALGFSLIKNHPLVDGNKRIAFAATDALLRLNGFRLAGSDDDLEAMFLAHAAGSIDREAFTDGVRAHLEPRRKEDR